MARVAELELSPCTVHTDEELSGNHDLDVKAAPPLAAKQILAALGVRGPEDPAPHWAIAFEETPGGLALTFHSPAVGASGRVPQSVEVFWKDRRLGSLPCVRGSGA